MADRNVFLVGMPAVGKSTIGRLLSKLLKCEFYDSDREIEERAGADTPWIFDVEGEAGFRTREQQVIDDLSKLQGIVLATGGGAVLREANRNALSSRGVVILLDSSDQRIAQRTKRDSRRPLFADGDASATIRRLRAERLPLYREIADYEFITDKKAPRAVAQEILQDANLLL